LDEILSHNSQTTQIKASIWIVYNILLEYCSRTNYKSAISDVTMVYKNYIDEVNKSLKEEIDNLNSVNKKLTDRVNNIEFNYQTLCSENNALLLNKTELKNQLTELKDRHEKEITLRLNYETKLIHITELYRNIENRFLVVSKEFLTLSEKLKRSYEDLILFKNENADIRTNINKLEREYTYAISNKELNDRIIMQKDEIINHLKQQYKSIYEESMQKLSNHNAIESLNKEITKELNIKKEENNAYQIYKNEDNEKINNLNEIIHKQEYAYKDIT